MLNPHALEYEALARRDAALAEAARRRLLREAQGTEPARRGAAVWLGAVMQEVWPLVAGAWALVQWLWWLPRHAPRQLARLRVWHHVAGWP